MLNTRGEKTVNSVTFDIQEKLLGHLRLVNFALTQKENPDAQESKIIPLSESDAATIKNSQKYFEVQPLAESKTAPTDKSQSRQEFLNENGEQFTTFSNTLQQLFIRANSAFAHLKDLGLKGNEEKKLIVLGAVFNSSELITQCRSSLRPLLKKIKKKNVELETLQALPEKSQEIEDKIQQLQSDKEKLKSKMNRILDKLKTSDSVKNKIIELAEKSQSECMTFLEHIRECTKVFDRFRTCLDTLNKAGFYSVNGRMINCWSGTQAQIKANTTLTSVSDSNVPAFSVFSCIAMFLREIGERYLSDILFIIISAEFAMNARGDVEIFSSTSSKGVFTVGNFHWDFEEEVLILLKEYGIVNDLLEFSYRKKDKKNDEENDEEVWYWTEEPRKLFEDEMEFAYRRLSDPALSPKTNRRIRTLKEYGDDSRHTFLLQPKRENSNSQAPSPISSLSVTVDDDSPATTPRGSYSSTDEISPRTPRTPRTPRELYGLVSQVVTVDGILNPPQLPSPISTQTAALRKISSQRTVTTTILLNLLPTATPVEVPVPHEVLDVQQDTVVPNQTVKEQENSLVKAELKEDTFLQKPPVSLVTNTVSDSKEASRSGSVSDIGQWGSKKEPAALSVEAPKQSKNSSFIPCCSVS